MPTLSLQTLGQVRILVDGELASGFESDKVRALLIFIAVESDRIHRRASLASLLWAERPEGSALNNLRGALSNLRKTIGDHTAVPSFITATRQTIQFNAESCCWLDTAELTGLTIKTCSAKALEDLLSCYQGSFLEGFTVPGSLPFEDWCVLKREQFDRRIYRIYQQLIALYEEAGKDDKALNLAWKWVDFAPLDEMAYCTLMQLLWSAGQRSTALMQYDCLCKALMLELDVLPSAMTQNLYQRIVADNDQQRR